MTISTNLLARLFCAILLSTLAPFVHAADEALQVTIGDEPKPTVQLWLATSLERVFPQTKPGSQKLEVLAAPRPGRQREYQDRYANKCG